MAGAKKEIPDFREQRIFRLHLAQQIEAVAARPMSITIEVPQNAGLDQLRLFPKGMARLKSLDDRNYRCGAFRRRVPWFCMAIWTCGSFIRLIGGLAAVVLPAPKQASGHQQAQQGAPPNIDRQGENNGRCQTYAHSNTLLKKSRPQGF
ncbi:MAG: hypothetical protein QNJ61_02300 [Desulfobacterales bacterium]|nr:hypothetical protein [Desulfobacterales bacterium]